MSRSARDVQDELRKALESQRRSALRWDKRVKKLRDELLDLGCDHPDTREYQWEWDSGYGVQRTKTGLQCKLCRMRKPWKTMGQWQRMNY